MSRSCSIEICSFVFLWYRFQIRYHDQIEQKSIKDGAKISKKSKSWIDLFFFKVWKIIVHDFENDACFWRKRRSLKVGQVVITISNKRKRDRETKLYILSTIIIKMIHKKSNKTSVLLKVSKFENVLLVSSNLPINQWNFFQDLCPSL